MTSAPAQRPRARARRGQGERLREEILEATERLLIQTGDQGAVSIRAIAEAAGVTPPSIYLHFADKDELIFAVSERQFTELDRVMQAAVVGIDDPVEELYQRGKAYVRFGLEHPEQYRILFMRGGSHTPAASDEGRIRKASAFDHMVEAVARCIDAGAFPKGSDPFIVAIELWAIVHGLTSLIVSKPTFSWPDAEALTDHLLAATCAGLQAAPPFRPPKRARARR